MKRIKALDIHKRGFITALYGLENDSFVGDDLRIYNMEQQLHLYLKDEGFETIVFYSSTDGFYAYEKESLARFMDIPASSPMQTNTQAHLFDPVKTKQPVAGRKLVHKASPSNTFQEKTYTDDFLYCPDMSRGYYIRKGRMAYDSIVSKLLSVLDNKKKVTLIIHVTMSETELSEPLARQLEERLRRISDNYQMRANKNKLLINYHLVTEENGFANSFGSLYRSIFTTPFFHNLFIAGDHHHPMKTGNVFYIGTPDKQEIRNYINRLRIIENKKTEWLALDEICSQLEAKKYTITPVSTLSNGNNEENTKALSEIFKSVSEITFESLKQGRFVISPQIEIDTKSIQQKLRQIKGQQDMSDLIISDIQSWSRQQKRERPLSFFSVGTSGVGKTFTTECVYESLKEAGFDYIRFNMTEFSQEHEGAKLIGSPPGYVGSTTRPRLFETLRKNRRLVICFDEIEKAHDTVITMLMNLLDAGSLNWNDETGDFTDCIIFFTSNLMQEEVVNTKKEMQEELNLPSAELIRTVLFQNRIRDIFKNPVHDKRLRPEFCGRIDRFLVYNTLEAEDVISIAVQTIRKANNDLSKKHFSINPTYLFEIAQSYANSMYGVRGLKKDILEAIKGNETIFLQDTKCKSDTDSIHKALLLYKDYLNKPKINIDESLLKDRLQVIKGQDEIIEVLIRDLKSWSCIPVHTQPLIFFAVGTSGVGKTFTVEQLADALKSSGYRSVIFSMTEYSRESDVTKLIGSAPGYAGAQTRPELFSHIAACRRLVICFDEIEKAHPLIMKTLMQLLDKGRLSWNGEIGDFRDCIILFTSNLEQQKMVDAKNLTLKKFDSPVEALRSSELKKSITDICCSSESFQIPVEVWGRINRFLVYNPLQAKDVIEIAIQECCQLVKKIYLKQLIYIVPDFLADLAEKCSNSPLGMRPLKDEIRNCITDAANELANSNMGKCQLIRKSKTYILHETDKESSDWGKVHSIALTTYKERKFQIHLFDKQALINKLSEVYCQEDKAQLLASKIAIWFMKPIKTAPLTLFLAGTSGTGKTYTSRIIASFLSEYGYEFTDINMAEYGNEGDVWKLIGSATGYMGSDKKPLLKQAYDHSPKQVLLFDEIEKANFKILDAIMRLMERGLITLNDTECDFSQSILIFTSNIAMDRLVTCKQQLEHKGIFCENPIYQKEMKDIIASAGFRPDILGRINTVAVYNPLNERSLIKISINEIRKLGRQYNLQINNIDAAIVKEMALLFEGSNEGARPVCNYCEMLLGEVFALSAVRYGVLDIIRTDIDNNYKLTPSKDNNIISINELYNNIIHGTKK